jgi:MFS family permease
LQKAKTRNKALPFDGPFFYGWVVVFIAAMGVFFSGPGQTYSVSVFIDHYINEFGWSRSFVSSMYSMGTLAAGFLLPFVGRLVDRKGHRIMNTAIALIFGGACLWMSFVGNPIMLFVGFFLIRMWGQGSMSLGAVTLVPQWFVTRRGRALSFMALGGALSSAMLPPFNTWLNYTFGWRVGWRFWVAALWLVMAPLTYFLVRNKPEDVGLLPDGERVPHADDPIEDKPTDLDDSWTAAEAMKTRSFWLLLFCTMIPSAVGTGMIFHQVSIMNEAGISPQAAAFVMSLMAIVQLPFSFVAGYIADRVPIRFVVAGNFLIQIAIIAVLLNTRSMPMAIFYACMRGVAAAFESIQGGVIWPSYFGRTHLGSIRSVAMTASVIGSAFGPLPFGFGYDLFGGYREVLLIAMLFPALGAVAAMMSPPPKKTQVTA